MRIVYFDESSDDGYPLYSSELFVLTAIYLDDQKWKTIYESIVEFRRELKTKFSMPVKLEMHTKQFLLDKNPYR